MQFSREERLAERAGGPTGLLGYQIERQRCDSAVAFYLSIRNTRS